MNLEKQRKIILADESDLETIVRIYNSSIASRMSTANTEPVTVESRRQWFKDHEPQTRPLWLLKEADSILGWLGLQSFYGRPAYKHTVEVSVYVDPLYLKKGVASDLLRYALSKSSELDIKTLLAFIFAHNKPSLDLFEKFGFVAWGELPAVAVLDEQWADLKILGRKVS